MAKNKVVAGDYVGYKVKSSWGKIYFKPPLFSQNNIVIQLDSSMVYGYEVVTSEQRRSVVSSLIRGFIGKYIFGAVGMLSGVVSAKDSGVVTIAVTFHNGQRSLIEVGNRQYKALIKSVF